MELEDAIDLGVASLSVKESPDSPSEEEGLEEYLLLDRGKELKLFKEFFLGYFKQTLFFLNKMSSASIVSNGETGERMGEGLCSICGKSSERSTEDSRSFSETVVSSCSSQSTPSEICLRLIREEKLKTAFSK